MLKLYYYNIAEKQMMSVIFFFRKVLDFSFSNEGSMFVFQVPEMGKRHVIFMILLFTHRQITMISQEILTPLYR